MANIGASIILLCTALLLTRASDPACAKGVRHSSACCSRSCGSCGGTGCSAKPGGASACCEGPIKRASRSCDKYDPPCEIAGDPPPAPPFAATATLALAGAVATVAPEFASFTFDASAWRSIDLDGRDDAQAGAYGATLDVLAAALLPAHLRVGGTQADYDVYSGFGAGSSTCDALPPPMSAYRCRTIDPTQFSSLLNFTARNGLSLVFGLNDLYGRPTKTKPETKLCSGGSCPPRNQSNAAALLRWVAAQSPRTVYAFELGNELNSCLDGLEGAKTQAGDLAALKHLLKEIWWPSTPPAVIGPDTHSALEFASSELDWFATFAAASDGAAAALTFHEYSLGNGPTLDPAKLNASFLSPAQLDRSGQGARNLRKALAATLPHAPLWAGESAAANNGGKSGITDTFIDAFWYLDQLGALAVQNVSVFLRQTLLSSGGYPLVELSKSASKRISARGAVVTPLPDYW
eukprot:4221553-Prymnesium_polylepis.1